MSVLSSLSLTVWYTDVPVAEGTLVICVSGTLLHIILD